MLIAGKHFPETPDGYRSAADHVWSLSPVFEQEGYELMREARRMEADDRVRRRFVFVLAAISLAALVWQFI